VLGVNVLFLLFEEMPKTLILCGIISQIAHLSIIQTFPLFEILSPSFIITVGKIRKILIKFKAVFAGQNIYFYVPCGFFFGKVNFKYMFKKSISQPYNLGTEKALLKGENMK